MKEMQPPKRLQGVKKIFAVDVDHLTDETFTSQIMNSKRKKNVHLGKKILLDNIWTIFAFLQEINTFKWGLKLEQF